MKFVAALLFLSSCVRTVEVPAVIPPKYLLTCTDNGTISYQGIVDKAFYYRGAWEFTDAEHDIEVWTSTTCTRVKIKTQQAK